MPSSSTAASSAPQLRSGAVPAESAQQTLSQSVWCFQRLDACGACSCMPVHAPAYRPCHIGPCASSVSRQNRVSSLSLTSHSVNAEIEQNTATVTPQSVNMPAAQAAPKPKRVMIDAPRGQVPSPAPLFTSPGYGPPLRGRGGGKAGTVPGRKVYSINATAHTVGLSPGRFPSPTPDSVILPRCKSIRAILPHTKTVLNTRQTGYASHTHMQQQHR